MEPVTPFFDYCVQEECIKNNTYDAMIKKLYEYGYRTIAINQTLDQTCIEPKKKKKKGEPRESDVVPAPAELKAVRGCEDMKILNRLTIVFSNQDIIHKIVKSPHYKKYHIIAVSPTTQPAFQFASHNIDADILTFDPEQKSNYKCNRKQYNHLVSRGFHIEIPYAPAIEDSTKRRNIIQTAHLYHTFGKSKNIIVSSGAHKPILIRGPYDVINLGLILGLNEEQSKNAISHCGRNVFINSVGRRAGKVVVMVEDTNDSRPVTCKEKENVEIEDEDMELPANKKIKPSNDVL